MRVAVCGSGPGGLACPPQLARAGHAVTVFEKNDRLGGLLRYGIPDFKMEKHLINRRAQQMEAEGVEFRTSVEVGVMVSMDSLRENYDAVVLAGGAEHPRPLRSEEHTSELQSLMRTSYAVFCLKKEITDNINGTNISYLIKL